MMLAIFTALVGLSCAPVRLDSLATLAAALAIAAGVGAAGTLNMWYDADIDAVMSRTAMRPRRSRCSAASPASATPCTRQHKKIVLANSAAAVRFVGAAGALPPVIGWAAATGGVGFEPLTLFFILFLWTPPHFWALALNRTDDYARAGIPMLPVVAGKPSTARQILIYSGLLALTSELPWALGFAGALYLAFDP
jgi:protoheme IX farnesyltransferase